MTIVAPLKLRSLVPNGILSFVLSLLAAYAPLLALHGYHLLERQHYEFAPLALGLAVAAVGLYFSKQPPVLALSPWRGCLAVAAAVLSVLLLVTAVWLHSPWLAAVSALCLAAVWLAILDQRSRIGLFPIWIGLCLLIPPPFQLDQTLITRLQLGITETASNQLDWLGVQHLREGVTLTFPDKQLFVEEACSGINSLLVLLSLATLWAFWTGSGLLLIVVYLGSAVFWAIIVNTARLLLIAYTYGKFHVDLTSGIIHTALGIAFFMVGFGLMISSLVFLQAVASEVLRRAVIAVLNQEEEQDQVPSFLVRNWNWLVGIPKVDPDEDEGLRDAIDSFTSWEEQLPPEPLYRISPATYRILTGIFAGIALLEAATWAARPGASPAESLATTGPTQRVSRESLPKRYVEWQLVDYEIQDRGPRSGCPHSHVWTYTSPRFTALFSLDYPYSQPHNLSLCYRGIGWEIDSESIAAVPSQHLHAPWKVKEIHCSKEGFEKGLVMFSAFDRLGEPLTPPGADNIGGMFKERFGAALETTETYQVQIFVATDLAINQADQEAIKEMFLDFRDAILERWRSL